MHPHSSMPGKTYIAPKLVVVHFAMEHGYALSTGSIDPEQLQMDLVMLGIEEEGNYQQTEVFYIGWRDSENNGFFD